jgi:uncharacterized membrane protein (UPF0136 family)
MSDSAAYLTGIYGALLLAGGLMGYAKARSIPSLVSGGVAGALLIYASSQLDNAPSFGYPLSIGISALLTVFMGNRYLQSKKTMPLIVSSLGAVVSVFNLYYFLQSKK